MRVEEGEKERESGREDGNEWGKRRKKEIQWRELSLGKRQDLGKKSTSVFKKVQDEEKMRKMDDRIYGSHEIKRITGEMGAK